MNFSRRLFGFIYLVGAIVNVAMIVLTPEIYREFADQALIPFYRNSWNSLVIPNLYVFVSLTIAFEMGLGACFYSVAGFSVWLTLLAWGSISDLYLLAGRSFTPTGYWFWSSYI
ncbi:hypothetical protein KGY77_09480 [Candidatus Bipolaricaulota bacterium]|nr:hypothetical protein [Candidatus Bipolaricaulota bacterium]MBS3792860.1 hypothetical protein [Candidatus Bipolaricaulota bacterium]